MIILDNYALRKTPRPGYKLTGYVYGHHDPRFEDGSCIIISNPIAFDRDNRVIVTRSGTRYKLGKIHPKYAEEKPDAENRLFSALEEKITSPDNCLT